MFFQPLAGWLRRLLWWILPVFLSTVFPAAGFAQQSVIEEILEDMTLEGDVHQDFSQLQEYLEYLMKHPVNINHADRQALEDLLLLNDFQINSLLEYRRETGPVLSLYELALVYGFDRETVQRIEPFITVETNRAAPASGFGRNEMVLRGTRRLEKAAGYVSPDTLEAGPAYPGFRTGTYLRYNGVWSDHVETGIIVQQDPGEPYQFRKRQAGVDFLSGYVHYRRAHAVLSEIIAGSFHLRFGQGLVLWSGFSMDISPQVMAVRKKTQGIVPYRSSDENDGFRGIVSSVRLHRITIIPFFSSRYRDARFSVDTDSVNQQECIVSLPVTGLHRTLSEQEVRRTSRETSAGFHLSWTGDNFSTGLTLAHTVFDHPFCRESDLSRLYDHVQRENQAVGLNYTYRKKTLVFAGEGAISNNGSLAGIQTIQWYLSSRAALSSVIRYYDPRYQAWHANGFSEGGKTQNESGIYTGIELKPFPYLTVSGYLDYFRFPWITYSTSAPSSGNGWLLTTTFTPSDRFSLFLRYINKQKEVSYLPDGGTIEEIAWQESQHLRLQGNMSVLPSLRFVTRLDMTRYRFPGSSADGFLTYVQLRYQPASRSLTADVRYSLFGVSGYGARIYTYENDLLYSFSTPVFSGKGVRTFLLIRYGISSHMTIGCKLGRTVYSDRSSIGQGNDLIPYPHSTDIKLQVRCSF